MKEQIDLLLGEAAEGVVLEVDLAYDLLGEVVGFELSRMLQRMIVKMVLRQYLQVKVAKMLLHNIEGEVGEVVEVAEVEVVHNFQEEMVEVEIAQNFQEKMVAVEPSHFLQLMAMEVRLPEVVEETLYVPWEKRLQVWLFHVL